MALYKSRAGQPFVGQRIDGQVWAPAGPGATIRGWCYPTEHKSSRWARLNAVVLGAGAAWAAMDPGQRATWNAAPLPWPFPPWWLWCWLKPVYTYPLFDAEDYYKQTVAWSALLEYAPPEVPPAVGTVLADDSLAVAPGVDVNVTWSRTAAVGPGVFYAAVFARARLTSDRTAGPHCKQSFVGYVTCRPATAFPVGFMVAAAGLSAPGQRPKLLVFIGEPGVVPLYAQWLEAAV